MSERFSKLFSIPTDLYSEGCPVAVVAGALYRDLITNRIIAQLKMKNIGSKKIVSCDVALNAFAITGTGLAGIDIFSYLDLNVGSGEEFGEQIPIIFPDNKTRRFSFAITKICFEDGTCFTNSGLEWKQVPERKELEKELETAFFAKKHEIMGEYIPEYTDGLYLCSCGNYTLDTEDYCCSCGRKQAGFEHYRNLVENECSNAYDTALDLMKGKSTEEIRQAIATFDDLGNYKDAPLKMEECQNIRNDIQINRLRKLIIIMLFAAAIICVVALIYHYVEKNNAYNAALKLEKQSRYREAISAFKKLDGFRDSNNEIKSCKYEMALDFYENDNYDYAIQLFSQIKNYKDSKKYINKATSISNYNEAKKQMRNKNYKKAIKLFEKNKEYKDSEELIQECKYGHIYEKLSDMAFHNSKEVNKGKKLISKLPSNYKNVKKIESALDFYKPYLGTYKSTDYRLKEEFSFYKFEGRWRANFNGMRFKYKSLHIKPNHNARMSDEVIVTKNAIKWIEYRPKMNFHHTYKRIK